MAVTYGFYNSVNGDRKYNAEQMAQIFDGIINDGVFSSVGTAFKVLPSSGMVISVGAGRAWFNHTWTYNDAAITLTVSTAPAGTLSRIDAVVIEVDANNRVNTIKIVAGTQAASPVRPTLTNSDGVYQYALAYITVAAGTTTITSAMIASVVGTDTPFVTGPLETVGVTVLYDYWRAEFETWFDHLQDELDSNQAANLQHQIDDMKIDTAIELSPASRIATGLDEGDTVSDAIVDLVKRSTFIKRSFFRYSGIDTSFRSSGGWGTPYAPSILFENDRYIVYRYRIYGKFGSSTSNTHYNTVAIWNKEYNKLKIYDYTTLSAEPYYTISDSALTVTVDYDDINDVFYVNVDGHLSTCRANTDDYFLTPLQANTSTSRFPRGTILRTSNNISSTQIRIAYYSNGYTYIYTYSNWPSSQSQTSRTLISGYSGTQSWLNNHSGHKLGIFAFSSNSISASMTLLVGIYDYFSDTFVQHVFDYSFITANGITNPGNIAIAHVDETRVFLYARDTGALFVITPSSGSAMVKTPPPLSSIKTTSYGINNAGVYNNMLYLLGTAGIVAYNLNTYDIEASITWLSIITRDLLPLYNICNGEFNDTDLIYSYANYIDTINAYYRQHIADGYAIVQTWMRNDVSNNYTLCKLSLDDFVLSALPFYSDGIADIIKQTDDEYLALPLSTANDAVTYGFGFKIKECVDVEKEVEAE